MVYFLCVSRLFGFSIRYITIVNELVLILKRVFIYLLNALLDILLKLHLYWAYFYFLTSNLINFTFF